MPGMKKVNINGENYEIPNRAKHIARDSDGEWWWYTNSPEILYGGWGKSQDCGYIFTEHLERWEDTARMV